MKLSTRARYALRAMMVVAHEGHDGHPVNLRAVAECTGISRRYLEQVTISLKSAGLLKGLSGKHGGHLLGRPAGEISLLEIVEAAIGSINVVECAETPEDCDRQEDCECRALYRLVNRRISTALREFTLADLVRGRTHEVLEAELATERARSGRSG